MKTVHQFAVLILSAIIGLLTVVVVKTLLLHPPPHESEPCHVNESDFIALEPSMVGRFQQALRFQTISQSVGDYSEEQLNRFVEFIIASMCIMHYILIDKSSLFTGEQFNTYVLVQ